jgi:hypothetical protein
VIVGVGLGIMVGVTVDVGLGVVEGGVGEINCIFVGDAVILGLGVDVEVGV